jgi:hypothetical protein
MSNGTDRKGKGAPPAGGLSKGLTSYGDAGFSLFLRKAFIKGAGFTDDALSRPVIGIASTASGQLLWLTAGERDEGYLPIACCH